MDDKVLQELFTRQGQAIATLALRITTIEQILLEKEIITDDDITKRAIQLSKEFATKAQEALSKLAEESKQEG
jgi:hypothetical protein